MLFRLALTSLTRHRARTILAVLGVAVSAAMLLDMVMLASGMRSSFRSLLLTRGFQLRIAPKGTLPFDTEALIDSASHVRERVSAIPGVVAVSPVLGGQVQVELGDRVQAASALGVDPTVQGDYEVILGHEPRRPDELVASDDVLQAIGAHVGDRLWVATGFDPQLRTYVSRRPFVIAASAHFLYAAPGQRLIGMPLQTLQQMRGAEADDRVSLFMVRVRDGVDAEATRAEIDRVVPKVSAASIATAMKQVDERLSYFRQLAFVLGTLSLFVGFLLVTTLVTVSVNERIGEIAVLRAIGVSRGRIVLQILIEGVAIMLTGALAGLALGLVTGRYLNTILSDFPGLPAAMEFFLFEPHDAWAALALLFASGVLAGLYPSWRGASLPIATTLREEAIA